jgi:lipopolysaccharide biosynthesis glycosyltransferase
VVIACGADDRYVQPLAVMLRSALANLSPDREAVVYVVDGGIEAEHKARLRNGWPERASLHFLPVRESSLAGLPLWGRMPVATYYKLLVPVLLPASLPKAIWLDSDLVVVGDLARLWDEDVLRCHALAVQDRAIPLVSSHNGVRDFRSLGIPSDARYFNAGVMVMNLERWRRDDVAHQVMEYLLQHRDRVVYWDQEGLNAVLAGQWEALDPRWNRIANPRGATNGNGDAWIIHYTGQLKPWLYPSGGRSHALYYRYLDQTAWAGWRPRWTLTGALLGRYHSSGLRNLIYPAEEWWTDLRRTFTRRYS